MVYVDSQKNPYGRMLMCHMLADTLEELHEMADKIGVARKHFQSDGTPHYDICQTKRASAIHYGATVADRKTIVGLIRKYRTDAKIEKDQ